MNIVVCCARLWVMLEWRVGIGGGHSKEDGAAVCCWPPAAPTMADVSVVYNLCH